jgi:hypothetical protein
MAKATTTPTPRRTRKAAKAKAAPTPAATRSTRKSEEALHAKQKVCKNTRTYWGGESNIVAGSVRFEETGPHANKQTVEIQTIGADGTPDGNTRRVATSDLHQVHHTAEVAQDLKKARKAAAAKARRERAAAALKAAEAAS